MAFAVFEVPMEKKGEITKITGDDLVSRQSIATRDSKALGMEGSRNFVLVEGSDEGVTKARELFASAEVPEAGNAEEVRSKIRSEEESAADGMGMLFG